MRAVLRFVASVMAISGVLLLLDAGLTVVWQEPISAFLAGREQAELKSELADPPRRVVRRMPLPGDAVARLRIPAIDVDEYVVEGTDTDHLRKGPGHYPDTPLPGQRGTVAIAGHRTTYGAPFRHVDELDPGDDILVDTPSGRFAYRVERVRIVDPTALWVTKRVGHDRLVLTACHPLYSAAQRIVVFAELSNEELSRDSSRSTNPIATASETATTATQ
jgi:sortase A